MGHRKEVLEQSPRKEVLEQSPHDFQWSRRQKGERWLKGGVGKGVAGMAYGEHGMSNGRQELVGYYRVLWLWPECGSPGKEPTNAQHPWMKNAPECCLWSRRHQWRWRPNGGWVEEAMGDENDWAMGELDPGGKEWVGRRLA